MPLPSSLLRNRAFCLGSDPVAGVLFVAWILRRRVLIAMAVAVPILAVGIGLVALGVSVWVVRPLVVIAVLVLFIPLTRSRDH